MKAIPGKPISPNVRSNFKQYLPTCISFLVVHRRYLDVPIGQSIQVSTVSSIVAICHCMPAHLSGRISHSMYPIHAARDLGITYIAYTCMLQSWKFRNETPCSSLICIREKLLETFDTFLRRTSVYLLG